MPGMVLTVLEQTAQDKWLGSLSVMRPPNANRNGLKGERLIKIPGVGPRPEDEEIGMVITNN